MQPVRTSRSRALSIGGVSYVTATHVAQETGVSRQTLWRWRFDGKVPMGRRYRDKQVLFTLAEFERIRDYAHRIEPLEPVTPANNVDQLRLFHPKKGTSR